MNLKNVPYQNLNGLFFGSLRFANSFAVELLNSCSALYSAKVVKYLKIKLKKVFAGLLIGTTN